MARGNSPRNHVLEIPFCLNIVRVFQFLFAVVLLGLSAYGVSQAYYDGFGATLFTSIATMIITVYIVVATEVSPIIYNYWAIFGLDLCLVLLWLISFAITASNSHQFDTFYDDYFVPIGFFFPFNYSTYRNALRVCATFGAIEFVMFLVSLGYTAVYIQRHKGAGGHCTPHPRGAAENVEMKRASGISGASTVAPTQDAQIAPAQDVPPV